MGKILDIRIMAQTYNEEEVPKAWPRLASLAWPQWMTKLGLDKIVDGIAGYSTGMSPVEQSLGQRKHGVVELAEALPDLLKFGDLPPGVVAALEEPVAQVEKINRSLAAALGDWDAKKASSLTFELEDALTNAEQSLKKAAR